MKALLEKMSLDADRLQSEGMGTRIAHSWPHDDMNNLGGGDAFARERRAALTFPHQASVERESALARWRSATL